MKYGMVFIGANFYDHNLEVHPSNASLFTDNAAEHNWRLNVEDAKMSWAKKRFAWVKWMEVDDHDGAAPPTVQIQEVRHPLKTRVQLNAKAAPSAKAAPKKSLANKAMSMDAAFMQVYQGPPAQLTVAQPVPDNQF